MQRTEQLFAAKNLKIVWIGFQDRLPKIREYMAKQDIGTSVGYDEGDRAAKTFGISYGAGVVIIDADGIVKKRIPKGFSGKSLSEAVQAALRG